ncbi:O-methyltransferase [Streptomyces caeruleatus]|uniref:SAM-dependent methyltransferase n=1 Tax=Streptomyces caeruleatus TaxID=661399 RepID=A0A101TEK5_9ACTN|nr:class I SAM-dependent methyltransferase [Streptomyces caeruleatus]KUN90906.1 SAM-dependent methyltransferase [Streptomyces caeruleatus]
MADQTEFSAELLTYLRGISLREDDILADLRSNTRELPLGHTMQVMPEEGQFLGFLASLTQARTIVEIGTFTGYAALCLARALPPDGRLITCDTNPKWPRYAAPYWKRAGVDHLIDVRIGDARDTLSALLDEHGESTVDLVFIDADKTGYHDYYEKTLRLLRPGGLAVLDNTALFGRVADPADQHEDTTAIRALNALLHRDPRVDLSLLPMADGITLARKRTP